LRFFCLLFSFIALTQCKHVTPSPGEPAAVENISGEVIARYAERSLYLRDILKTIPQDLPAEDSILFIKRYADRWVRKQVVLDKAREAFRSDIDLNTKVEDYRSSLLLNAWESDYVKKHLNTTVRPVEIQNYYDLHQADFTLDQPIIQGIFLKIKGDRKTTEPIERSWKKKEPIMDLSLLPDSSIVIASQRPDVWHSVMEWLNQIPSTVTGRSGFTKGRLMIKEHDGHVYMLRIDDKIETGEIAPLDYVKEKIEDIILHRRKLKMLEERKQQLFEQAVTANSFDINI